MYELLRSGLTKSGVDFAEMEQLYRKSVSEFAVETKKALAKTLEQSAALAAASERDLKNQQSRLSLLKNFSPVSPAINLTLLDTATSITASQISLSATNMAAQNNWAQFDYQTEDTSTGTVGFTYQWTNTSDLYVVVNVIGFIAFNGVVVAATDGSFWPFDHQHSHTTISTYMVMTALGSGAVFEGGYLTGPILNADSGGGWLGNPGDYETATVFRGLPPTYDAITIPPQSALQIDVIGEFSSDIDSGYAEFNFAGDARQVSSLGVILSIVS
jgi:hypothetical protein